MHWLWMGVALAASPYKGRDGDVVVKHTMAAEPERIYAVISDLQKLAEVVPEPCIEDWAFGVESTGERATARGTFHFKAMRRRLTLGYSDLKPDRGVIIEGEGKKGFSTRIAITQTDAGVEVELGSYLYPPPWPFRKYYFEVVHPTWSQCWTDTLMALEDAASP